MPSSPLGVELRVLEKVAVGMEQRDIVRGADRPVAE